jgi:hypothetical protein
MSVIGFRRWRVSSAGDLVGLGVPYVWESGAQTATCRGLDGVGFGNCAPFRVWPGHQVPSMRSRCGIWAHREPIQPCQCGDPGSPAHGVVGAVRLWGRYVEHENGWRAEHARVVALVDFTGRVDPRYEAPRYPDLLSLYGEWATGQPGRETGWAPGEGQVWCDPDLAMPAAISFIQYAVQVGVDLQRGVKPVLDWLVRLADGNRAPSAPPHPEPDGPEPDGREPETDGPDGRGPEDGTGKPPSGTG